MPGASVAYDHQIFGLQQFGGISRYFCEIASRIPALAQIATRVIAPVHFNEYLDGFAGDKWALFRPIPFRGAGRAYRALNRAVAPALIAASSPTIVHWTYFKPPRSGGHSRTVVTVYDMIHELFGKEFPNDDVTSSDKRHCVTTADHVVCISESTKVDLMRLFDVPEKKISVIYLGYSDAFVPQREQSNAVAKVQRPYLLYVGHRRGYKGFENAVRAYAGARSVRDQFDLIAFGGPAFTKEEDDLVRSLGLRQGCVSRVTGGDEALASAYRGARAFVYPSRYEGFGIPPLEAMACGCPVACSNTSSLPEVVGSAAELFDPQCIDSIGAALERVCFDSALRVELVERGFRRASRFSWDRCAQETAAMYEQVIGVQPMRSRRDVGRSAKGLSD